MIYNNVSADPNIFSGRSVQILKIHGIPSKKAKARISRKDIAIRTKTKLFRIQYRLFCRLSELFF